MQDKMSHYFLDELPLTPYHGCGEVKEVLHSNFFSNFMQGQLIQTWIIPFF